MKGQFSTPENPGKSLLMLWICEHRSYSGDDCLIWPFTRRRNGYGAIGRGGKILDVHRYMCRLVHGEPPTPDHQAAHSCERGHEGCCNPRHLSWKTRSQNLKDGWAQGRRKGRRYILTAESAAEIRAALGGVEKIEEIATRYGVSEAHIRRIRDGRSWAVICETCRFWDKKSLNPKETAIPASPKTARKCRRYPQDVFKHPTEWCGEHRPGVTVDGEQG